MERPRRPLILLAVLLVLLTGFSLRAYAKYQEDAALADTQAREREAKFASATALQVWAAGSRSPDGKFCGACSPNPTLLYSTSDPAEVREVLANFRYRRSAPDEPEVANCGIITIDFLRDEKILLSANLKPQRLERASWTFVESWLNKRDLLKKAGAVLVGPRKNP